ncbi:MAG: trigger factor [Bacteroidetes bacterium]|nr:MAG: trigger factor [Bacteroidota bacterium]RLD95220.1 MAG: trigger factor [Bacteroidota bacterium]
MNISQENSGKLNAILNVKVEEVDYAERVEKVLKDYRKQAKVDGFRPGMVPMGIIKKMYHTPVLVDEVNKLVSESLFNYLQENKVNILGEPLPHKDDVQKFDFEKDTEFEFKFDLGLAPELNMEVSAKDKVPFYKIKVDKKQQGEHKESLLQRFGEFKAVDKAGNDELIKGSLVKVNKEGKEVENGIRVDNVSMSLEMMKDDDQRVLFSGAAGGDQVVFDVKKAFPNDTELASLLRIEKTEVAMLEGTFKCFIDEVNKFERAEPGQEFYDKVYGEGEVKTEEEFTKRVTEEIALNYERESEYRFMVDAREALIKKAKIDLPVEFLKRWMVETNEQITEEQVAEDFEKYEDDFRWQLIKEHLLKQQDIKVSEEEALEAAKAMVLNQYMQYGMSNVPEEYLENYAREMMAKPEESRKFYEQKGEEKLISYIKSIVKLDEKEVSSEKFRKLYEK